MKPALLLLMFLGCGSSTDPGRTVEELFEHYRIASSPGSLSIPEELISDKDLISILTDPRTPPLTSIELSGNQIGNSGLEHLLQSPKTQALRFLNLANNDLDNESARLLSLSPRMASVEYLLLAGNELSAEGVQHLAESPHFKSLRNLSLGAQNLGYDSAALLAKLGPLQTLDLTAAGLSASGASFLLENTQTQKLLLAENPLQTGEFSLQKFSDQLIHLDLRNCGLSARQIQGLQQVNSGANLETINLSNNPLKDSGLEALGSAQWLIGLKKLEAYESQSTLDARRALRESWGRRGGLKVETR